jgi:hypothetical protein
MVANGGKMKRMDKVKKISVSMPESLIAEAKVLAEKESRSLSSMLTILVKRGMKK